MIQVRHVLLLSVLVLGAWALRAPSVESKEERGGAEAGVSHATGNRPYVVRIVPDFYMPGKRFNPGDPPLRAFRDVADEFEKLHPDTRIEIVDAPVGQREWLVTQLAAGQAPEILNVNVEDVWQDVQKGWYIPLDSFLEAPNPYVKPGEPGSKQWWDLFRYQDISRSKAAPDGKMYCITLDMIETGIFYNKTLFAKLGLRPPKDWEEFMRIHETIQKAGVTPMLVDVGSLADWGVDLTFDQLYRDIRPTLDLKKDPKRDMFYKGYLDWDELAFLNRKGFFTEQDPRWREVFRLLKDWRRFMPKDLGSTDFTRDFIQEKGAMFWSSSLSVQRLLRDPRRTFDWGMFYLPPITKATSKYGGGYPQCIIGEAATQFTVTNSAITDTGKAETSTKLKRCVEFLEFATVPRNCDKIVNEITALMPNVLGVPTKKALDPFVQNLLHHPYTTTKWVYTFDLRFSEVMNRMLLLYLMDGVSDEEFMDWMVKNVRTSCDTIVRRKHLDLAPFEKAWAAAAPLRKGMVDLPRDAQ
ncbi:ABC transporter substrate-binding protein [Fimbriimonas ginsengisoli]|uniref:ABC transporter sugar binding protein n=1 Tax=Fimbriimonas ginsengisoli Gsoil 348 TaxID=661478 RepID=A0A068NTI1_FIMGI|nr:extracellular solute-binding protein [Fimbriimonas ginsengisoli]AIE84924.1 ABC transporter sugar binding protein [Fimbriimonas ginsengisoli Gsoil 348]